MNCCGFVLSNFRLFLLNVFLISSLFREIDQPVGIQSQLYFTLKPTLTRTKPTLTPLVLTQIQCQPFDRMPLKMDGGYLGRDESRSRTISVPFFYIYIYIWERRDLPIIYKLITQIP